MGTPGPEKHRRPAFARSYGEAGARKTRRRRGRAGALAAKERVDRKVNSADLLVGGKVCRGGRAIWFGALLSGGGRGAQPLNTLNTRKRGKCEIGDRRDWAGIKSDVHALDKLVFLAANDEAF